DVAVAHNVRYFLDSDTLYGDAVADHRDDLWFFGPHVTGMTAFWSENGHCPSCLVDQKTIAFVATADGDIWEGVRKAHAIQSAIHGIKDPAGMAVLPAHFTGDDEPQVYVAEQGTGSILKCATEFGTKETFVSDAGIPNFLAFFE